MSQKTNNQTAAREAGQNSYRFQNLNDSQRQQAVRMALKDGRPNCIGLRFTLDRMGNVNGYRDEYPHIPHHHKEMHCDPQALIQPVVEEKETREDKARRILREHNYRLIATTTMHSQSKLELYGGPKGTVILQIWNENNGVTMYADWPLGTTWEQTEIALSK